MTSNETLHYSTVICYWILQTTQDSSRPLKIVLMQYIQWLPICKHSKSEFIAVSDKIKTIQTTQQAAYIVQLIFGLCILGIFFPIMAAMQFWEKDQDLMCIPGEGLEERRNLGICKSVCSFVALLLKIISS